MGKRSLEADSVLVAVDLLANLIPGARLHLAALLRQAAREVGAEWNAASVLEEEASQLIADEAKRYRDLSSKE